MAISYTHVRPKRPKKNTRAEQNLITKRKLFEAAQKVVGELGYAEASVARITAEAGVAQGTFYNHFFNRQELLDQLLPELGKEMLEFIRQRTRKNVPEAEREADRFKAFFSFAEAVPEFFRILNEAEFFAPQGYKEHMSVVSSAYVRLLQKARDRGEIEDIPDEQIYVITHILMGARGYLGQHYLVDGDKIARPPEEMFLAYAKLLNGGLFRLDQQ